MILNFDLRFYCELENFVLQNVCSGVMIKDLHELIFLHFSSY